MPALSVRLTPAQHAEIRRRAEAAGFSVADYVRHAALGSETPRLLREIHARVCGPSGAAGLPEEAAAALALLVQLGEPPGPARQAIEKIIVDHPQLTAPEIVKEFHRDPSLRCAQRA